MYIRHLQLRFVHSSQIARMGVGWQLHCTHVCMGIFALKLVF